MTVPLSGPLEAGHGHEERRLARAGGPDQADRLARGRSSRETPLRICTRAAPRPRLRSTSSGRWPCPASSITRSLPSTWVRPNRRRLNPTHMGRIPMKRQDGFVATLRVARLRPRARALRGRPGPGAKGPAAGRSAIVALGDSLTAGYGLPARGGLSQPFWSRRSRRRVTRSRSSMRASPAIPRRRRSTGSTGRCRTAPTASSSNSAPTTCCAASIRRCRAGPSTRSSPG